MATTTKSFLALCLISMVVFTANGQLSTTYYNTSCPNLEAIVYSVMKQAAGFWGASILRLHFHDCFVNGCDGSVLLDDTPSMRGEKNAPPNANSLRGYEVIDSIKANVEKACKAKVSCADILALAARDSVALLGGPRWNVELGRKDAKTASYQDAINNLPATNASLQSLIGLYRSKGLDPKDMTAINGAHTIGMAHCSKFRSHIYNDKNVNAAYATQLKKSCPASGGDNNLAPMDPTGSGKFDNGYYRNLKEKKGMFASDQDLYNNGPMDSLVDKYSTDTGAFFYDFVVAMLKMGRMPGKNGEIRLNCRKKN